MAAHLYDGVVSMFAAYGGVRGWCNKGDSAGRKRWYTCCCCEYSLQAFQCCLSCVLCYNVCWLCCARECCDKRQTRYLKRKLHVDRVARKLRTGDIILFSSDNALTKVGTASLWTHVNMIFRPRRSAQPFCFEVTLHRWMPSRNKGGSQLVPFLEKIKTYDKGGRFAWRRLRRFAMTRERKAALAAFMAEIEDRPYQRDHTELLRAGLGFGNSFDTPADYFCSEAVAEAYKRLGLLDPATPANRYAPADFGSELRAGQGMQLLGGAKLDPEVEITRDEDVALIQRAEHARHALTSGVQSRNRGAAAVASAISVALAVAVPDVISYHAMIAPAQGDVQSSEATESTDGSTAACANPTTRARAAHESTLGDALPAADSGWSSSSVAECTLVVPQLPRAGWSRPAELGSASSSFSLTSVCSDTTIESTD